MHLTLVLFYLKTEKRLVSMTRRDLSHNILEVAHTNGGEERWLVVKRMLYPKKASLAHYVFIYVKNVHKNSGNNMRLASVLFTCVLVPVLPSFNWPLMCCVCGPGPYASVPLLYSSGERNVSFKLHARKLISKVQ